MFVVHFPFVEISDVIIPRESDALCVEELVKACSPNLLVVEEQ